MLKAKTILKSAEFSAAEKAQIINALVAEGCTKSTAYVRLFRDGFAQWQLDGITSIVAEYAALHDLVVPEPLDANFYLALPSRENFKEFINERGMCSVTAQVRFALWNFKPWELKGVNQILHQLLGL